ncbi:MAG: protein kinase [Kofleriaceae bacterium]
MGPDDSGTEPVVRDTPVPVDGDGEELIGLVIDGRYRLESTLGRGGMGLVYRAGHLTLRRQVAVKILHPSLAASPDVRNRFEREALAVGKIDHPNCVSVYDSGRLRDGSLYLAMELLDGKSLADVLEAEGQIAPGRALHILAHMLRGLAHIHQAGLIHRDIKPENIFLIRQGEDVDFAKILDFGIAKPMTASDLDDGVKLTQAGMAFGTPIYMAPEQALGNPMDGRADLYAASVLAYEMLCGQPPFYSDDKLEVMSMHTAKPVPPMRQRMIKGGKPVPSSIERLIIRGLTKKPSERFANADVYLAEVEAALHTSDGGVTEVNVPRVSDTGSQPLVTPDGRVNITSASEFAPEAATDAIADAIDDVLAAPPPARPKDPVVPAVAAKPPTVAAPVRKGGVGLGLPYTGPTGEPIFGLTPEQRLASAMRGPEGVFMDGRESGLTNKLEPDPASMIGPPPVRRKRWPLYAAIAAGAAVIGVVVAIATLPDGKSPGLDPDSPAGQAFAALDQGDPARALKILDANKEAIANDGMAQLLLGHAHAARHENPPSLVAYRRALELAPNLEADQTLRANLRAMAADPQPEIVTAAFDLWVGSTKDDKASPLLLKAAVAEDLARRRAARPVVERLELVDRVDWLLAYSYDLEQEATCELRKEAVAKLRALNDRRAVAALERAMIRKGTGAMRKQLFSPCLVDDAKAAIGYLRGLPK